jgi:hypothetical protein
MSSVDELCIIAKDANLNWQDRNALILAIDRMDSLEKALVQTSDRLIETQRRLTAVSDQLIEARKSAPPVRWQMSSGWMKVEGWK